MCERARNHRESRERPRLSPETTRNRRDPRAGGAADTPRVPRTHESKSRAVDRLKLPSVRTTQSHAITIPPTAPTMRESTETCSVNKPVPTAPRHQVF